MLYQQEGRMGKRDRGRPRQTMHRHGIDCRKEERKLSIFLGTPIKTLIETCVCICNCVYPLLGPASYTVYSIAFRHQLYSNHPYIRHHMRLHFLHLGLRGIFTTTWGHRHIRKATANH